VQTLVSANQKRFRFTAIEGCSVVTGVLLGLLGIDWLLDIRH